MAVPSGFVAGDAADMAEIEMKLLVRHDRQGNRELALEPPQGREPVAFVRLEPVEAFNLAIELMHQISWGWVGIPARPVGKEG